MPEYIQFLTAFLTDHGLHVDVNDYVRYSDNDRTPILVDGRRLALPTERHRRNPNDETILLHPLAENTVADLSPVMKEIVRLGSINLNILFATFGVEIIQLASDTGRQNNLTDNQIDLIAKLKSCKSSAEKNVAKIAGDLMTDYTMKNQTTGFIQLGLMRGRNYRGEKRHRACSVSFPMYERLLHDQTVPKAQARFDLTGDERNTLIELHEAMFPAVSEAEAYGYAEVTNRTIAPFFVTYAMTYAQLAGEFRARYKTLQGAVPFQAQDEPPLLDWVQDIQNTDILLKWANGIPDQTVLRVSAPQTEYKPTDSVSTAVQVAQPQKDDGIPYVGQKYITSSGQLAEVPPPNAEARPRGPEVPKNAISPDEFLRTYASGSPLTAMLNTQSMLKAYTEGYGKFWDGHIQKFRIAPQGLPHPTSIPAGILPPAYPNHSALPMGFYPGGPMTATVTPVNTMVPGMMHPGMMQPGMFPGQQMHPGMQMHPAMMAGMHPGMMHPGQQMMHPGMMQPGMMQPGQGGVGAYGGAVNTGISSHPAFAGLSVGAGTVSPGTV